MSQSTLVVKLDRTNGQRLREALDAAGFAFRGVPHALFSAKGDGHVTTFYKSGKLVVQGGDPELFLQRFLGDAAPKSAPAAPASSPKRELELEHEGPMIGGDESGKGDYFGPLVVACVRIGPGDAERLRKGGVGDSKALTDERVRQLAPAIESAFPVAVEVLAPPAYNAEHGRVGNVNLILASVYRRAVERIAEPGITVLIDQFSKNKGRLDDAFSGLEVELHQAHRAERNMAVAAASIVARLRFLDGLASLSEEFGVDLHKGAGPPTMRSARRFLELHGGERLGEVAKLHFATTKKLGVAL